MRSTLLIAAKDLRQRLRDRSAVLIAVVVPLGLAAIFRLILGDVLGGQLTFDLAVVDADGGRLAQAFAGEVLPPIEEQGVINVRPVATEQEGRRLAEDGEVDAAFVIPAGFTAAVEAGRPAELRVIGNVDAQVGTAVARSIAESFAGELGAVQLSVAVVATARGLTPGSPELAAIAGRAAAAPSPIAIEDLSATKKELDPATYYAAGMSVFFLFFTVQFGVTSLLDERRDGTMSRLLAAPIRRGSILGGKLLTSYALGVVSTGVLVFATSLALGADWGNPTGVALLVLTGVLAATSITALVTTLAKNAEQAGSWQSIIAVVLGILGGAFFPVSQAGGLIARLSLATPHAWFLRGLADLAGGGGIEAVLLPAGVMLAFAAAVGALAVLRINRALSLT